MRQDEPLFLFFLCKIWKKRTERPNVGGVPIVKTRNGAPSRKECVVNVQTTSRNGILGLEMDAWSMFRGLKASNT